MSQNDVGIGYIRGRVAMTAIEFVKDGDAKKPDPERTKAIVSEARDRGLVLLSCGVRGNVIRFLPALTIPMDILDLGLERFSDAVRATVA